MGDSESCPLSSEDQRAVDFAKRRIKMGKQVRMSRFAAAVYVLGLTVLFLAGCSQKNKYARQLSLEPLPAPQILADVQEQCAAYPHLKDIPDSIRQMTASNTDQLEKVMAQSQGAFGLVGLFTDIPPGYEKQRDEMTANGNQGMAFYQRAVKIKRAQLQDGDANDSTGEVEENLKNGLQCVANSAFLADTIAKARDKSSAAGVTSATLPTPAPTEVTVPTPASDNAAAESQGEMPKLTEQGIDMIERADTPAAARELAEQFHATGRRLSDEANDRFQRGEQNSGMHTLRCAEVNESLELAASNREQELNGSVDAEKAQAERKKMYLSARSAAREAEEYLNR